MLQTFKLNSAITGTNVCFTHQLRHTHEANSTSH